MLPLARFPPCLGASQTGPDRIEAEHGVALDVVLNPRLLVEYAGDSVSIDKAAETIELAEAFVAPITENFSL